MNDIFRPVPREQKIVDHLFPFFGTLAKKHQSDVKALAICRQLIALQDEAMDAPVIGPYLDIWQSQCPEERDLQTHELHWALLTLEENLSRQLHDIHTRRPDIAERERAKGHVRPKLRVIQGGMPGKKAVDTTKLFEDA